LLPYGQNTVYVQYRLTQGDGPVRLKLRPSLHFRSHDAPVNEVLVKGYAVAAAEGRMEIHGGPPQPTLRFFLYGTRGAFTIEGQAIKDILYRVEESRGY